MFSKHDFHLARQCAIGTAVAVTGLFSGCLSQLYGTNGTLHRDHLVARRPLPAIAVLLTNGSITDFPGHQIPAAHQSSLGLIPPILNSRESQEADSDEQLILWPGIGQISVTVEFFTAIGRAADQDKSCESVDEQRCVPELDGFFLTCASSKKWELTQHCGQGALCSSYPGKHSRVLCATPV